jgi:hypothetical protein
LPGADLEPGALQQLAQVEADVVSSSAIKIRTRRV